MTNVLQNNPPNADEHISVHGSDFLWAWVAVLLFSLFITVFFHFQVG